MQNLASILACAAMALFASSAIASPTSEQGEARLSRMLEGRTAGQPVSCIDAMNGNKMQVIDEVALVYDAGKTIYVARPVDPHQLRRNDAIVMERFSPTRLCVQDSIRTIDRYDGYTTGALFLKDFVPYTKSG